MKIFDWLKEITLNKNNWDSFSEEDKKSFNPWMVNRFLSMDSNYIEVVDIVQKYQHLTDKQLYTLYQTLIPKNNVFLKYIKGKKDKNSTEDMKYLANYFECSTREVKDYMEFTPKKEMVNILDNFKVKTSKKKVKK
ncbi:hypothetical protein OAA15_00490 [bacterium]|nr:hypothetical protein [bacterium]